MLRQGVLVFLLIIVLAGVGLRSYELTARSLWFDEAFSWRLIQFPTDEMIERDATDVHPPLYYVLLKGWAKVFGSSLLSLRSFSVFLAGLTILAAYLFTGYAVRSRLAGILAASLIAFSGFQIQFAWEARMYTLGTFLVIISSWFLLRGLRERKARDWLFYSLSVAALLYVHYYAFFSVAAQVLFLVGYFLASTRGRVGEILQDKNFWLAGSALVLTAIIFLPWVPVFLEQSSQVQESYWIPEIGGWSIPDTFYRMFWPTSGIPRHEGVSWIALAIVPMAVVFAVWFVLAGIFGREKGSADAVWLIVLSGLVPFLLSIGLSFLGQSLYQDRFFVFAHLFILIALAVVICKIPWANLRRAVALLMIIFFVTAFGAYWSELDITSKPGARAATKEIADSVEPGDKVIVSSPFIYFAILHYSQENFNLGAVPRFYSESGKLSHFAGGPILTDEDIVGREVFEGNDSIWVVDTTGFGSSKLDVPAGWRLVKSETYDEVFAHQGEVFVSYYQND